MINAPSTALASQRSEFFTAFLEAYKDGILIVTEHRQCLHQNRQAQQICQEIAPGSAVPSQIWRICHALIDSRELYPHQNCVLEDLILIADQLSYRVEVQWLDPGNPKSAILVTLEPLQTKLSWLDGLHLERELSPDREWLQALA